MADKNGYIGRSPSDSSVLVARQTNQPTSDTSTFVFSAGYDIGYLDVYVNGSKLVNALDYTATDTRSVILTTPATNGDVIEFVAYKSFQVTQVITEAQGDLTVDGSVSGTDGNFTGDITSNTIESNTITQNGVGVVTTGGDGSTLTGIVTTITAGNNISVNQSTGSVVITGLANTANVIADTLVVTGVSTFSSSILATNIQADTYTGSGQGLTGLSTNFVSAVGIQSGGTPIGVGITQINFIGIGNTFKVDGTTVDISIESGGGAGLSTVGVSTGYIFSNPSVLNESADLTQPGHNYAVFGPITIGAGVTITVGAGNTFTVA